jgi:hypothetical protein
MASRFHDPDKEQHFKIVNKKGPSVNIVALQSSLRYVISKYLVEIEAKYEKHEGKEKSYLYISHHTFQTNYTHKFLV